MNVLNRINGQDNLMPSFDYLANKSRVLYLTEPITTPVATVMMADLACLKQKSNLPITIFISSPGGEMDAGGAIIDAIEDCQNGGISVITVATGLVASMASVILAAGTKGKRYITPRARVLIHQPLVGFQGQATDAQIALNEGLKKKKQLIQYLSERTGKTEKQIAQDIERDYILDAKESLKYGIVDVIGYPDCI